VSLALSTLIYEWRRYMAAVIALALSGLLILAQVGMFVGMGKAFTATIDRSPADIIVMPPKAENMDSDDGLPSRVKPTIYMHPEVKMVSELAGSGARWQNQPKGDQKSKSTFVQIMGIDPRPGSASLPADFPEEVRQALSQPFAVVVDQSALKGLGVNVGDDATLNGRNVKVAAALHGYSNMMQPQVFVSPDNMRVMGVTNPFRLTTGPLMVTLHRPEKAEAVRAQLNAVADGKYRAWTRPELAKANEAIVFGEQAVGILLGFSVLLGIGIGVGITSQTLRGAILSNIKEFASLRALGVSMGSLRTIVIELSFWVGVVGIIAALGLTMGVAALASARGVLLALTPSIMGGVSVLLLVIAMISGFFALGLLKKSQPADLLR
jgi:putative ABC transport system permease protein